MKKKGSLTVFAALSFMLIAQFIFVMLEAARYQEISKLCQMRTEANLESVFASYCTPLWEQYHILAINGGDFEGEFDLSKVQGIIDYQNYEMEKTSGVDLLRFSEISGDFKEYSLLTDNQGKEFYHSVAEYMKQNLIFEEAKFIYSYYESMKGFEDGGEYKDSSISEAIDGLNNPSKYDESEDTSSNSVTINSVSDEADNSQSENLKKDGTQADNSQINNIQADNPLESVSKSQSSGILDLVLPDGKKVSQSKLVTSECLSSREKNQGNMPASQPLDWYSKVLVEQYLINYMSSYTSARTGHALSYELEYIVAGKDSDEANLKSVVRRLLAIREGANMVYLLSNPAKVNDALILATAIAGATANPALIEAVKYGLLAAWAYCESILDVRALLQGDRIPALKSDTTWTSELTSIATLISGKAKAKSSNIGLNYGDYVGLLLLAKGQRDISYRAMDLMENSLRKTKGYEATKMDNMISSVKYISCYEYKSIFSNFINLVPGGKSNLKKEIRSEYSYYENNN